MLDLRNILQGFSDPVEQRVAPICVKHLPTTEENGKLHFVALLHEPAGVIYLDLNVVRVCLRPQPYLLYGQCVLMVLLVCLPKFSLLLIEPLAIVNYAAYGRITCRRYLN